jgi:hypothetical protein
LPEGFPRHLRRIGKVCGQSAPRPERGERSLSRWFRFYDDAINDPKLLRLSDKMHRAWVGILCMASKYNGVVPKADMAISLRVPGSSVNVIIAYLVEHNLLDDFGDVVTPHNWNGRQYKSDVSTDRVKRFRKRHGNVSSTVSETPPDTDTDTEAETEQKIDSAGASVHAEFLKLVGSDHDDPTLFGSLYGIQGMLARGFSRETILAGASNGMRGKARPPNWNYFAKCIESENEQRSAPAKKETERGKPENLVQTAKRMSAEIVGFGPRPSLIGGGTNSPDVRVLPEGGSERS